MRTGLGPDSLGPAPSVHVMASPAGWMETLAPWMATLGAAWRANPVGTSVQLAGTAPLLWAEGRPGAWRASPVWTPGPLSGMAPPERVAAVAEPSESRSRSGPARIRPARIGPAKSDLASLAEWPFQHPGTPISPSRPGAPLLAVLAPLSACGAAATSSSFGDSCPVGAVPPWAATLPCPCQARLTCAARSPAHACERSCRRPLRPRGSCMRSGGRSRSRGPMEPQQPCREVPRRSCASARSSERDLPRSRRTQKRPRR